MPLALAGLLLLSGMSALIYQVVWLRLLSLIVGVTVFAASAVLACFMGGFALGSLASGKLADRVRDPLRLLGIVELSIGACGLLMPAALAGVHRAYVLMFSWLPDSIVVSGFVRFLLAAIVLVPPTSLMGATLPLAVKAIVTRLDALGTRVGLLYATNTAGAIAGAVLAGFYLIPSVGLHRSLVVAACANGLAGFSAILLSFVKQRGTRIDTDTASAPDTGRAQAAFELTPTARRVVIGVFAVSGFASLALEVIWFRALAIVLGPTSYAFTLMLASVLVGIAAGSYLITPLLRLRLDWLQVLAWMQLAAGLATLYSYAYIWYPPPLPSWIGPLVSWMNADAVAPAALSSVAAILPAAIVFGLAFPVGLRLWAGTGGDARHSAERIGVFYAANVCGGILGSIAAGFVLLPALTSRESLIAIAALFLASGFALQSLLWGRRPLLTALSVFAVFPFVTAVDRLPRPTTSAAYIGGRPLLWHDEGVQTTVAVVDGGATRVMYLDGRHQANDSPNMVFVHRRIGLLPAILHPNPRRALVVGLGGGATAGALSLVPGLQVDVVELSEGVMRAADFFSHVNFQVRQRPNVSMKVDDGRNFLLRSRAPYDVITADSIVAHLAGANNLYSVEYFRLVRDALAPDGIALHWNGGANDTEHGLILRAFAHAFPYTTLWGDAKLMVGSKQPLTLSRSRIEKMFDDPAMRKLLALMNVERFDHLARMFRATPEQVRSAVGSGPLLTDDRPLIEYFAKMPPDAGIQLSSFHADIEAILRDERVP